MSSSSASPPSAKVGNKFMISCKNLISPTVSWASSVSGSIEFRMFLQVHRNKNNSTSHESNLPDDTHAITDHYAGMLWV